MSDTEGATAELARFVAESRAEDIPAAVRHEAKRAILNMFGTALAGCREDAVALALSSLRAFSDAQQATVIGREGKVDALSAAFLNAASANVFDFCDTHLDTVIHPTAPLAPALFALSELRARSGRDLLHAFALGYEVECRIGRAISPGHYRRGWHITSTCGVFGAAAGVGKLIGLDAQKLVWALGAAATQSAGLCECLGTEAKSISVGNAARNGLWSALLAERGYRGPAQPIEGAQGYLNAVGEVSDLGALTRGLGESWELARNACKPYPGGIVNHPVLDAIVELRAREGLAAEAVERIVVRGHPLLKQRTDRPEIATGRSAQVSVQHGVAVLLLFGDATLARYTDACVNDPAVAALRRRIAVEVDEAIAPEGAAVSVHLTDGRRHDAVVRYARGSAQRPMTDGEIEQKLRANARLWDPDASRDALVEAVWALDQAPDAGAVMALAAGGAPRQAQRRA
ncbi:MAG: MmgE/PrpD family protein [Variibacter sp.]|nr:MmgE/PrpD family protein [Variibacter sp.]